MPRRSTSISALMATEAPKAMTSPAQGLSSKAWPPMRPMKNAYSAQITAATAVAAVNRLRGYPVSPQVRVTAVRPPGMNRQTTMSCVPNRSSDRSAHARARMPFGVAKNLRCTAGPKRRPSR